jgi:hypothetical protein
MRPYSWVDVFLRNDVHIIGLQLDFAEIDLWWLLTVKERLRHKNASHKGRPRVGRTVFYDFQSTPPVPSDIARLSLLEGLGVQVVSFQIEAEWDYAKAFHRLLTDLRTVRLADGPSQQIPDGTRGASGPSPRTGRAGRKTRGA